MSNEDAAKAKEELARLLTEIAGIPVRVGEDIEWILTLTLAYLQELRKYPPKDGKADSRLAGSFDAVVYRLTKDRYLDEKRRINPQSKEEWERMRYRDPMVHEVPDWRMQELMSGPNKPSVPDRSPRTLPVDLAPRLESLVRQLREESKAVRADAKRARAHQSSRFMSSVTVIGTIAGLLGVYMGLAVALKWWPFGWG